MLYNLKIKLIEEFNNFKYVFIIATEFTKFLQTVLKNR